MSDSDETNITQETVPEPQKAIQDMQDQFLAMMQMMQANEDRNTARHEAMQAENLILRDELQAGGQLEDTPKKAAYLGRLTGPARGTPTLTRRTSKYYGNVEKIPAPKVLSSGDAFTKMQKFGGKAHESIREHFITFEYHARMTEECFWCDLLQLTFSKTIQTSIVTHV